MKPERVVTLGDINAARLNGSADGTFVSFSKYPDHAGWASAERAQDKQGNTAGQTTEAFMSLEAHEARIAADALSLQQNPSHTPESGAH